MYHKVPSSSAGTVAAPTKATATPTPTIIASAVPVTPSKLVKIISNGAATSTTAVSSTPSPVTSPSPLTPAPASTPTSIGAKLPVGSTPSPAEVRNQLAQKMHANKQSTMQRLKTNEPMLTTSEEEPVTPDAGKTKVVDGNSFVVTPDYIQQSKLKQIVHYILIRLSIYSILNMLIIFYHLFFLAAIKNALKQENLNPEIEEKLLNLQRYQEKQNILHKTHPSPLPNARNSIINHHTTPSASSTPAGGGQSPAKPPGSTAKRRPAAARHLDDDDWVLDTPRRKPPGAGTSTVGTPSNAAAAGSTSTETSPTILNKRSIAAKKRELEKKKAIQQAQVRIVAPMIIIMFSITLYVVCVWRSQTFRVCVLVECVSVLNSGSPQK